MTHLHRPIVLYEYQTGRSYEVPLQFYQGYRDLSEMAKPNNLKPYDYFRHLLNQLPKLYAKEENLDTTELDYLLPWSKELPNECRKPRR